jgi:diguanylate cyclase (GGDEF)-like protein
MMTGPWLFAALAASGALALALSYPRRAWGALAATAATLVAGASLVISLDDEARLMAAAATGLGLLGCGAVWLLARRRESDLERADNDMTLVRAAGEEIALKLQRLRARGAEVEREHRETLVFYSLIKGLSESISWDGLRPRLEGAVDQYMGVTEFALYLADPRTPGKLSPLTVKRLDSSPGSSWATLQRYLQERGWTPLQAHYSDKPESAVGLPIVHNGEALGYFYARAPKGSEPQALLAKAQRFCDEIAFAFRRLILFQEVESLSSIDGLTGVHRRGDFEDRLRHELVRAKTFKTTLGVMMLDIDHFKGLNDRYGHPFGDQVLRRIGELLKGSVYETDFVARYGGEEFVVVLPRAEPEGALRKAEAIRRAVESERFALALDTISVTISIGVAHFPRDGATPEELIAQADAALYHAKSQGRNRVIDSVALRRA